VTPSDKELRRLELFPTPPWATRALFEFVLPMIYGERGPIRIESCREPAAGLGHMAETIKEYCAHVLMSDVADYPLEDGSRMSEHGLVVEDFVDASDETSAEGCEWYITNPPFKETEEFLRRALKLASRGVALLQKQTFQTGGERYREVYVESPPDLVAQFAERVPMCLGGYDPRASSDMDYAWFIWLTPGERRLFCNWLNQRRVNAPTGWLDVLLIPPGQREAYFRERDLELAEKRRLPGWIPNQKIRKLRRLIHAERDARMMGGKS
jgi:hypothetical protein